MIYSKHNFYFYLFLIIIFYIDIVVVAVVSRRDRQKFNDLDQSLDR